MTVRDVPLSTAAAAGPSNPTKAKTGKLPQRHAAPRPRVRPTAGRVSSEVREDCRPRHST